MKAASMHTVNSPSHVKMREANESFWGIQIPGMTPLKTDLQLCFAERILPQLPGELEIMTLQSPNEDEF